MRKSSSDVVGECNNSTKYCGAHKMEEKAVTNNVV